MKSLMNIIGFVLTFNLAGAQNLHLPPAGHPHNEVDISSSQIFGCSLLGLGIATIGYTAAQTHHNKYPALWYTGGSILATAGILVLIFGDKEPQVKYWKGLESNLLNPARGNFAVLTMPHANRLSCNNCCCCSGH